MQSPKVQTYLGRVVAQRFLKKIPAQVSFSSVSFTPFNSIVLQDVLLMDPAPVVAEMDTVAYVRSLTARFSILGVFGGHGVFVKTVTGKDIVLNLAYENDSNAPKGSVINMMRVFGRPYSDPDKPALHWGKVLKAKEVDLENIHFRMKNIPSLEKALERNYYFGDHGINFYDMDFSVPSLEAYNVDVADDLIHAENVILQARENKTGFKIWEISAKKARVGKANVRVDDFFFMAEDSEVLFKYISLDGPQDDYSDFEEKIHMDGQILEVSKISTHTLSYFAPQLEGYNFQGYCTGHFQGFVNDLQLENFFVRDVRNDFGVRTSGRLSGLPKTESTVVDFKVREINFTSDGLTGFVRGWSPGVETDFGKFAKGERIRFSGTVRGLFNHMKVVGEVTSDIGDILADIYVDGAIDSDGPIKIDGNMRTQEFHLGKFIGNKSLGPVTLNTDMEAIFFDNGPSFRMDTLSITHLRALQYDYSGITASGIYKGEVFDGKVNVKDPNLDFSFEGRCNLNPNTEDAEYNFFANLAHANLYQLKLDKREVSNLSLTGEANFTRSTSGELIGDVVVHDLTMGNGKGVNNVGDIIVQAHSVNDQHRIRFLSGFMDANFTGSESVFTFISDLKALVLGRELTALSAKPLTEWSGAEYEVSMEMHDANDFLAFFVPGMYVENKTAARLKIDSDGFVGANLMSGRIARNEKFVKDLKLAMDNGGDDLSAVISGGTISLGSAINISGSQLEISARDNKIDASYSFNNGEEEDTRASLFLSGDLERKDGELEVTARVLPSDIHYKGKTWNILSNDIFYRGGDISVKKIQAVRDDEILQVDGGYSPSRKDTLKVKMERFDLSLLNTITGNAVPIEGSATGQAMVLSPSKPSAGLLANIICDSTYVSGKPLGTLDVTSVWDEENKRFNAFVRNKYNGAEQLDAEGYLVPSSGAIHAKARLQDMEMGVAEPLMSALFSTFTGKLDGEIGIDGTASDFHFSSKDLTIRNGKLLMDLTGVLYNLEGTLEMDNRGLHFKNTSLDDGEGGRGNVNGSIFLSGLKDIDMDTHIAFRDMKVLNLSRSQGEYFYGTGYGSGRVDITGPMQKMLVAVNVATTRAGNFRLPLNSSSIKSSTELLTFTEPEIEEEEDPYEVMMAAKRKEQRRRSDLGFTLTVRVTPEMQVYLDLSDENSLNAYGSGTIEIANRSSQGEFTMGGDYAISGGSFQFSAMNLVSRKFIVQEGSSVRFNGDVWNTDLNILGLYATKASLANLVADETAVTRRPVNCGINITGKIRNPEVDFSIDVPDLNPAAKALVDGALNTQDKIQKQFLYLLIAGNFLPSEESGISANGSDVLFSNVSSIMSGQLNNIFQKLNIPLDLGLNYQATQNGSNIFDVALSTQLFNNRVVVNGNVGNKPLYGGTATTEIVGDIDIEIKLNRSGSMRLKLFSHSADQFTYYLDNSQRNGGGIAYQREFNSFRTLFRKPREEKTMLPSASNRVVIQIDSTGKSKVINE